MLKWKKKRFEKTSTLVGWFGVCLRGSDNCIYHHFISDKIRADNASLANCERM